MRNYNQKKIKRVKKQNIDSITDTDTEIKTFVIIIVVIAALIGVIYFTTNLIKKNQKEETNVTEGVINYDKIAIGNMLNAPYDDYYVILYKSSSTKAILYTEAMSSYINKKEKKIYYCDLDNGLNKPYYNVNEDNKSNPNAKTIKELDLGEITLIQIKNKKIIKYVEGYEDIKSILK